MSYLGFLAELLLAECDDRARRRSERRIKAAAFPRQKSLREPDGHVAWVADDQQELVSQFPRWFG